MQEEYVTFEQRVATPDGPTWTVLDADYRVVQPIERYLEHLRPTDHSPNTVESYAKGLELWWTFLDARGQSWDRVGVTDVGTFLGQLRRGAVGVPPGSSRLLTATLRLVTRTRVEGQTLNPQDHPYESCRPTDDPYGPRDNPYGALDNP
uniref:site-specific integrase n=1 Tax=Nonomuraea bangladeshensis TaxID=404385 RepID=UPI003F497E59